eukprot:11403591-Alexandrium_andersonii.AAC.1
MAAMHVGVCRGNEARPARGIIDRHCGSAARSGGGMADHPAMAAGPLGPCRPWAQLGKLAAGL